jgi:hypothetical protein
MSTDVRKPSKIRFWAVLGAVGLGFAFLLVRSLAPVSGPVDIVWDKEACAHCHMHIGEKNMAGQVQLDDGRVMNFDDPGCLMSWLDASRDAVKAVYVRHHLQDRWLAKTEAAFVEISHSPMGYNLGAVAQGEGSALNWEAAAAKVRARENGPVGVRGGTP